MGRFFFSSLSIRPNVITRVHIKGKQNSESGGERERGREKRHRERGTGKGRKEGRRKKE
jgi:hypothetical protein